LDSSLMLGVPPMVLSGGIVIEIHPLRRFSFSSSYWTRNTVCLSKV